MNKLTLGSLFDGSGGFPLAGMRAGITPVWASEVEPYPIKVTRKNIPHMKHYGDISSMKGDEIEAVDIITFGSPCFPEGTVVLTDKGYVEIENIKIGDNVLTHKGRWRKVTNVGSKQAETIILKGNHYGLECTRNHPIYAAEQHKVLFTNSNGNISEKIGLGKSREWINAEDMEGRLWAVPNTTGYLPVAPIPERRNERENDFPDMTDDFFYLIGRYLGCGWVNISYRKGRKNPQYRIYICCSSRNEESLVNALNKVIKSFNGQNVENEDCIRYSFSCRPLAVWILENFGRESGSKFMASWVYNLPEKKKNALLQGILDSDGYCVDDNLCKVKSVGKKLAHGIRLLAESFGYRTTISVEKFLNSVKFYDREVNRRDCYTIQIRLTEGWTNLRDSLHTWYKVKSTTPTRESKIVYNLTVDEDNSYVADSIVVHNCQDLSIAGRQKGLHEGSRSNLFFEAIRIIKEMRETNGKKPRYIVWENVPNALSIHEGRDFRVVLESIIGVKDGDISIPKPKKWNKSGSVLGDGFSLAWRILDARYWGVPQRRRRIFLVADFAGHRAPEILFKPESSTWNPEKSLQKSEETSRNTRDSSKATSWPCLMDQGGERFYVTNEKTGTIRANMHGHPPVIPYKLPLSVEIYNNRLILNENDITQTLAAHMGTGGNNVPLLILPPVYSISGNTIGRQVHNGGNGKGFKCEEIYTLTATDRHCIAYAMSDRIRPDFCRNLSPVLMASDYKSPHLITTISGNNFFPTITANCGTKLWTWNQEAFTGDYLLYQDYGVRRITPKECSRLQGFPDYWTEDLEIEDPTEEDMIFWREVFEIHRKVITGGKKSKTDKQIRKWLSTKQPDAHEYKMWGNGVALPCVQYIMDNIAKK